MKIIIIFICLFVGIPALEIDIQPLTNYKITATESSNKTNIYKVLQCPNGETYDGQIDICRRTCQDNLIYSNLTGTCVDFETQANIDKYGPCKHLTLDSSLISNGILQIPQSNFTVSFKPTEYTLSYGKVKVCFPFTVRFRTCRRFGMNEFEYELRDNGLSLWLKPYKISLDTGDFFIREEKLAAVCDRTPNDDSRQITDGFNAADLYAITWTISTVSIAISLIVYAITYKKMRYHTKILISHMISLFIFYITLIVRAWSDPFSPKACIVYAVIVHYFFLAAFFWMNVLAYDIWKNLPRFSTSDYNPISDKNRIYLMSLYAWGCPAILALVALIVELYGPNGSVYKPHFSVQCFFMTIESKAVFLFGPLTIILSANIVFFILTVVNLRRLGKDAGLVNKKIHKQLVRMYLKLMIVMGVCWIMEVISNFVGNYNVYWYLPDMINGLQGFFLFIVYVCKPSVFRNLVSAWENKFGPMPCSKSNRAKRLSSARSTENSSTCSPNCDTGSTNISIIQVPGNGLKLYGAKQIKLVPE